MIRTESSQQQTEATPPREQPVIGYVVGALCIVGMIVITALSWDSMPDRIVTRAADATHTESAPHKAFSSAVAPAALAIILALMSLAPRWNALLEGTPLRTGTSLRARTRTLDIVLSSLSLCLVAVHVGVTALYTGEGPQLPQSAAWGVALVGAAMAVVLAVQDHDTDGSGGGLRAVAYGLGVVALATAVLSFVDTTKSLVVGGAGLVVAAVASSAVQLLSRRDH